MQPERGFPASDYQNSKHRTAPAQTKVLAKIKKEADETAYGETSPSRWETAMSYSYAKLDELENKPVVGTRQCVALVQIYAGAPITSAWRQGETVVGNLNIRKGTAIATFVNGRYPNRNHGNHAALFIRHGANGIWVMDQWKNEKKTTISSRFIACRGKSKSGGFISPSDNADAFSIIE